MTSTRTATGIVGPEPSPTLVEGLDERLRKTVADLGDLAETIAERPRSTIEPSRASAGAQGRRAIAGLEEQQEHRRFSGGLVLGETIGEGAMGVVRSATQRSVGRRVAVKTLRSESRTERGVLRLLREGWVTGALEHPNIVPVHDVGLDDDGAPLIVLKHIEGVDWASFIGAPEIARQRFGVTDPLDHNLRILVQLCNAVSLAHARGVIHRDLKPENVMVGGFGEVYLVDWGIAVSLRPDPTGRLPLASETSELAGTPAYMAPEMLGSGALSERTDVYLLGAVLHEILTGRPPHVREGFHAMVASIVLSRPTFADDVPPELAAIATKAMQPDPSDRFASAAEVRQRLEWYLAHRASLALSAEATRRLDEMKAVVGDPRAGRERLYLLFSEARFGFRQALVASDDNDAAREGLREAVATVVGFELARANPEAAASVLAELEDAPEALRQRVATALRTRETEKQRIARLERLDAELDLSTGRRTRVFVLLVLGVPWVAVPEIVHAIDPPPDRPYEEAYAWTFVIVVLGALVIAWGRESLGKTAVNRRMIAMCTLAFAGQLALQVASKLLGIPIDASMVLHVLVYFLAAAASAMLIERRLWPTAVGYLVALFVSARWPALKWHATALGHLVFVVNAVLAWARPREDRGYIRERLRRRARSLRGRPPDLRG